jgi:hypothetical protein
MLQRRYAKRADSFKKDAPAPSLASNTAKTFIYFLQKKRILTILSWGFR